MREDGEKRRENQIMYGNTTKDKERGGWLLTLEHGGGGVVVEGDVLDHVLLLVQGSQLLSHQNRLPRPGVPHQHHGPPAFQEPVQEVANTDGLCGVDQTRLATGETDINNQSPIQRYISHLRSSSLNMYSCVVPSSFSSFVHLHSVPPAESNNRLAFDYRTYLQELSHSLPVPPRDGRGRMLFSAHMDIFDRSEERRGRERVSSPV